MITWMQKHKKYLIITIWISTIAFVGAGFVGWGQYDYGEKAGSVAKVGSVDISMGELQKSYSNLYAQYSQMFQGEFDEEKANSFGLKSQALQYLIQQALVLNLAKSYDLQVSEAEVLAEITAQTPFQVDGVFNKERYKEVLTNNNIKIKEYEEDVKKELLIRKTLSLLTTDAKESELKILDTAISIADKINYKVLDANTINIDTADEFLKPFWESKKSDFMTEISYDIKFIKQPKTSKDYDDATLNEYYNDNKTSFKDEEGKILAFDVAKERVKAELDAKESKKEALKTYVAYKKGEAEGLEIQTSTISPTNNPFGIDAFEIISKLTLLSPFSKPVMVGEDYYTFELVKVNQPQPKSYEEAKRDVIYLYVDGQKRTKLLDLANKSFATFNGTTTDFITGNDSAKLADLSKDEADEFLAELFTSQQKRGFVTLESGNIVMYNVLEQKLLNNTNTNQSNPIVRLKSAMFNEGLIKNLQNKYQTEIFIQGL